MDSYNAIVILEALAAGCSPATGEAIDNDSVLNERGVIRALQIAIDKLKTDIPLSRQVSQNDINAAVLVFRENDLTLTGKRVSEFLLGSLRFKTEQINLNPLYGKYRGVVPNGQMLDFVKKYIVANNLQTKKSRMNQPWSEIVFFREPVFNKLSDMAVEQLKSKIVEIGITKTENLAEYVFKARKQYYRAYEPWSEAEKELLRKAMEYTNDIKFLSQCFQRGKGAIESCGQRMIFESDIK